MWKVLLSLVLLFLFVLLFLIGPQARAAWPAWFRAYSVAELAQPDLVLEDERYLWVCYWEPDPDPYSSAVWWAGVKLVKATPAWPQTRMAGWLPADDAKCDPASQCHPQ